MELEYYFKEDCPNCEKVRDYILDNGLEAYIDFYDISDDFEANARLNDISGGNYVPCLVVNGKAILEAEDIIEYLGRTPELQASP